MTTINKEKLLNDMYELFDKAYELKVTIVGTELFEEHDDYLIEDICKDILNLIAEIK